MPPTARDRWSPPRRRGGKHLALVRRGVHHGCVTAAPRPAVKLADAAADWSTGRPILVRGALANLDGMRAELVRTQRLFERARHSGDVERELRRRLASAPGFALAGVSVDLNDPREILKVHADETEGSGARDLWAKLSWIALESSDVSLRMRFSFGAEQLGDWHADARRAQAADRLAEAMFPECRLVAGNLALVRGLERLAGRALRLSERIVYSNAPGGGAEFHHDAEARQLGVLYAQLVGATGWLALPQGELAEAIAQVVHGTRLARVAGTRARALRALEREPAPALARLLNGDARLTRALVERGAFICLRRGDALILPSPRPAVAPWHSVFALGRAPSLAHSYGIFAAPRGRRRG